MSALLVLLLLAGDPLLADLANPNCQIRRKAVLAAEGRNEPAVLERLLAMAVSDPHPNIRGYVAEVLGSFRDKRIFPILAKMARDEKFGPRHHAYVGLGKLGDPRGKKILLEGLKAGRITRGYAAKGLGLLGDADGFQPVTHLLQQHADDPYVADLAPEALVRMRKADGLAFLRRHFAGFPTYTRLSAARVLGAHADEKTRVMMEGLLEKEDDGLRGAALLVLSELQDRKSTPALLAHLARRADDRAVVVEALGKARDPRAVKPLLAALRAEKDLLVKLRLIEALGLLGDKAAIPDLLPLLGDTTLHRQPRVSAIYGFPWNTRVHAAAVWAILTIRDGKEPFHRNDISDFPNGIMPPRIAKDVKALREG